MQKYSITKALNLPEFKITEIISVTDEEIHIRLKPCVKDMGTDPI